MVTRLHQERVNFIFDFRLPLPVRLSVESLFVVSPESKINPKVIFITHHENYLGQFIKNIGAQIQLTMWSFSLYYKLWKDDTAVAQPCADNCDNEKNLYEAKFSFVLNDVDFISRFFLKWPEGKEFWHKISLATWTSGWTSGLNSWQVLITCASSVSSSSSHPQVYGRMEKLLICSVNTNTKPALIEVNHRAPGLTANQK